MRILNIVQRYRLYGLEYVRHGKGWKMPASLIHFHGFIPFETYFTDDYEDIISKATSVATHMSYVLGGDVSIQRNGKVVKIIRFKDRFDLDLDELNNRIKEVEVELQRKSDARPVGAMGKSCLE